VKQQVKNRGQLRWDGFDILKCLCAFLIVCIHTPYPGIGYIYFNSLCRIAVPIFFMITGFFSQTVVDKEREIKQIKKITIIFIGANLLYFVFSILIVALKGTGVLNYLKSTLTIKTLLKFLILNESPFGGHLWYLGAILYVLVIVALARRFRLMKLLYFLTPFLLIIDLVAGKYSILLFDREFPYIIVRNFLFVGIPYFCIGSFISKYKNVINEKLSDKKWVLGVCIVLFSATTLLEKYMLVIHNINATRDHYISTTFLSCVVFVLFMLTYHREINTPEHIAARIGREYSTLIYVVHPIFITVLSYIFGKIGLASLYTPLRPIIVYIFTIAGVAFYQFLLKKIRQLKEKSRLV